MDFKKKLKSRRNVAIIYIAIGILMILIGLKIKNDFLSSFGLAIAVCGSALLKKYFLITKSEERIKKQEIVENDERNIAISNKAKSISFSAYLILASIVIIACVVSGNEIVAQCIELSVCVLIFVYWLSYYILRKKY